MFGLDVLVSVANLVYLASYSVRDILWLRCLTVVGSLMLMPYYYLQPQPLWAAISWNVVFIAINLYWIAKLLSERRPVRFSEEESHVRRLALAHVSDREARHLFDRGSWITVPAETSLLIQNEPVEMLTVFASGQASVRINDLPIDTVSDGRILGATAYFSRGTGFVAPVTVKTTEETRLIRWSFAELDALFAGDADFKADIEAVLGLELSRYLKTARAHLPHFRLS